nr:reverse transcriptase domain-containing protein [Tanacetum cinerariifolium]
SIKVIGVTDDALPLYLFPHSLTHHATAWFDRLPKNSINTFEQMAKMFLGGTFMKRRPLHGRIGSFPGYSPEDDGFLDSFFGSEIYGSDCYGFDFG